MNFVKIIIISVLFISCSSAPKKEKVSQYVIPNHKVMTLKNGMEVILIQNSKLPLFELSLLIPAGTQNDSEKKQGLAYITGHLLKMGSLKRSAAEISESFELKGSDFSVGVFKDYAMMEGSSLSKYKTELFSDFIEVLTQPKFSLSEFNRFKKKLTAQNSKSLDDASQMASLAMNNILFKGSPYGLKNTGTVKSLRRIRQRDVRSFYNKFYTPEGSIMAIVGDFTEKDIQPYLDQLSASWKSKTEVKKVVFPKLNDGKRRVHLVHKPESKQTQIRFGHLGIARSNKDFIALRVANAILGQGFSSRLLTEVRVKRGLSYTVSSSFAARKEQGPFLINTFTRHDKVQETISTVLQTVETYLKSGVTDQELEVAKSYLIGTFPRALETSSNVATNIMLLKYFGVSLDYLKTYTLKVSEITKEDILRVANEYIHPENLQIVVLSDKNKVLEELKSFEDVKNYSHKEFN